MDRDIITFIFRRSRREQALVVVITLLALPFYYTSLEMPKLIVDKALRATPENFPLPITLGGVEIAQLGQLQLLVALCVTFLLAVAANGAVKFVLNVYKGRLGERLLRELREDLCARALRFPLARLGEVTPEELNTMISAEVDPLGGYIGDALALPLLQGGLLLTAIVFIFLQDPIMGLAAVALFPVQGLLIPRLQRQVNALARERVREVRRLSARLGESVESLAEIRAMAAETHALSLLGEHLARIYDLRYELFRRKSFIKLLNNFLFQVTPFLFLLVGGWLVIRGQLSLGALVAVLAAYKDLPPPARELLGYYQTQQDAHIKYDQVIAQFGQTVPETGASAAPGPAAGALAAVGVGLDAADGSTLAESISFEVGAGERVAIVGAGRALGLALARAIAGLREAERGHVTLDGRRLDEISGPERAHAIGYVDAEPGFFNGSIRHNLCFGLDPSEAVPSTERVLRTLRDAGLDEDLFHLGLDTIIDPARHPDLANAVLDARRALRGALTEREESLVERFDPGAYCRHGTVAENLLCARAPNGTGDAERIVESPAFARALARAGLEAPLVALGLEAAEAALASPHLRAPPQPLVHEDEVRAAAAALGRARLGGARALRRGQRHLMASVALRVVAARHRGFAPDPDLVARCIAARPLVAAALPETSRGALAPLDPDVFNPGLTLRENLLFGVVLDEHLARLGGLEQHLARLLEARGLRAAIAEAGLGYRIGVRGARLSASERQRLALARALVREPAALVLCRATDDLEPDLEAEVHARVLAACAGRTVVWILQRPALARGFDRVLVLQQGQLVETGAPATLDAPGTRFRALLDAA